jgi:raffinose/stachyose/melibiose transport system permease protein
MAYCATRVQAPLYLRMMYRDTPPQALNILFFLTAADFRTMLKNSAILMAGTTAATLFVGGRAASGFARMRFRSRNLWFNILTPGLMLPLAIAIPPVFRVIRQRKMTDMLPAILLVQTPFAVSGNVMIPREFFLSIPLELEDAAYINGCTPFGFFWRILLPMTRPAPAAAAALGMTARSNDVLVSPVILKRESLWTLPQMTSVIQGRPGNNTPIVSGLTAGAVKQSF